MRTLLNGLTNEEYTKSLPVLFNASLGQHVRHVLECYICLIKGIPIGVVDYDRRERDQKIECNVVHAIFVIDSICEAIDRMNQNATLQFCGDCGLHERNRFSITSNCERELMHNLDHAIHHQALIKIGLNSIDRLYLISDDFGVAPSSLRNAQLNQK